MNKQSDYCRNACLVSFVLGNTLMGQCCRSIPPRSALSGTDQLDRAADEVEDTAIRWRTVLDQFDEQSPVERNCISDWFIAWRLQRPENDAAICKIEPEWRRQEILTDRFPEKHGRHANDAPHFEKTQSTVETPVWVAKVMSTTLCMLRREAINHQLIPLANAIGLAWTTIGDAAIICKTSEGAAQVDTADQAAKGIADSLHMLQILAKSQRLIPLANAIGLAWTIAIELLQSPSPADLLVLGSHTPANDPSAVDPAEKSP